MKIVALHTDFRIYWPARLKALNNYLKSKGDSLEVIEIAGKGSPYSFANKDRVDGVSWNILFPDSIPEELSGKDIKKKLFNLLDNLNPDVILAGAIAFPSGALAVQWTNSRPDKRIIIFDDAKIEAVKRNRFINFIKQSVYNGVDAMLYPAEPWIDTGLFWGFDKSQIYFGVDVVDNDFWSQPVDDKPFDFKYFVSVGRQIPKKNYFTIVKAFHKYLNSVPRQDAYKLVLIGNGPEHRRIRDYIRLNKLEEMVLCFDFMTQQELRSVYHNAALLCCNSSISETWGLVINEAMCAGCAIIASRQCGATEVLVREGINGYKTECDDIEGLVDAMIKYHNLSELDKFKMREASKTIISNWGLDRFSKSVYDAAIGALNKERTPNILSKFIINNWNGRYNPV